MQKNRIELAGYLADKPQVRYMPSGMPVANVRMAEGYRYTDRNNQSQEHTNWHNLVFYGDLADIAVTYEKGENVFVEGTLQTRKFTLKDGSARTIYEIIARSVYLIAKPRTTKEAPEDNAPQMDETTKEVESDAAVWPS
jgi:single-strand DNA-binding protein